MLYIFMTIAAVIAIARFFMEKIEREDREAGLYLNKREYSITRTLSHTFRSDESRIKKEKEITFADFLLRDNRKWSRKIARYSFIAMGLCGAELVIGLIVGTNDWLTAVVSIVLILISGLTNSLFLLIILLIYQLLTVRTLYGILLIIAAVLPAVILIRARAAYKKEVS